MRRVYMDANATTPLVPEVFEAMRPFFMERSGNASSIHMEGQQARAAVDQARESVAALIGARSSEIVFTSGGTESDNLALFGGLRAGDHLITSAIEHSAVLHAAQELGEARGCGDLYGLRQRQPHHGQTRAGGDAAGDEAGQHHARE